MDKAYPKYIQRIPEMDTKRILFIHFGYLKDTIWISKRYNLDILYPFGYLKDTIWIHPS
jgi:hypothetical protein